MSLPTVKHTLTPDDYHPSTLAEIQASAPVATTQSGDSLAVGQAQTFRYRVRATCTGQIRPSANKEQQALQRWAQLSASNPTPYLEDYKNEMLFVAQGKNYWLPTRAPVAARLVRECPSGDVFDVFVLQIPDATSTPGSTVVLVEDYAKAKAPDLKR